MGRFFAALYLLYSFTEGRVQLLINISIYQDIRNLAFVISRSMSVANYRHCVSPVYFRCITAIT